MMILKDFKKKHILSVLIVVTIDQGPISDNPIEDRLRDQCYYHVKEYGFGKLFDRQYILNWLNNKTDKIIREGNKLIKLDK